MICTQIWMPSSGSVGELRRYESGLEYTSMSKHLPVSSPDLIWIDLPHEKKDLAHRIFSLNIEWKVGNGVTNWGWGSKQQFHRFPYLHGSRRDTREGRRVKPSPKVWGPTGKAGLILDSHQGEGMDVVHELKMAKPADISFRLSGASRSKWPPLASLFWLRRESTRSRVGLPHWLVSSQGHFRKLAGMLWSLLSNFFYLFNLSVMRHERASRVNFVDNLSSSFIETLCWSDVWHLYQSNFNWLHLNWKSNPFNKKKSFLKCYKAKTCTFFLSHSLSLTDGRSRRGWGTEKINEPWHLQSGEVRTVKEQFCRPFVDLFHFVTHIVVFLFFVEMRRWQLWWRRGVWPPLVC